MIAAKFQRMLLFLAVDHYRSCPRNTIIGMGYMVMKEKYLQRIIGAVLRLLQSEPHASSTAPIHVSIYKGK